jgi:chromosomal replication initiator protein
MGVDSSEMLWNRASVALQQELSNVGFDSWIRPLRPIALQNGRLTLIAPNAMVRDTVQNRYATLIQRALDEAGDATATVVPAFLLANEWEGVSPVRTRRAGTLNPNYTFDSFVVGKSNQFAWAASSGAAKSPGTKYNPLFIYGGTGLGKTHLMHAIGHEILNNTPDANVLYVTSEQFTNEMISTLQNKRNEQFRDRYRNVDTLLIDDVQFIANKETTVEEFFHTFNALYERNKQIVLTSDKPPKEIPSLEERLRSRFEWGLIADIAPPDYETRVAILRNKAAKEGVVIAEEGVMESIAMRVESNIRELEGSLNRVIAYASLLGKPVTIALAEEALKDYFNQKKRIVTPRNIIQSVCAYFDITHDDICSKRRSRDIVRPRHIAMYLVRTLTDTPQQKIAEYLNVNDHTSVIHGCRRIETDMEADPATKDTVDDLIARITETD